MINKDTVDHIIETSRIEEVVGDFVSLKKRGVNMIGLCPFHNEKTPSFTVSPAKGIYKCFGCGKAGNSVNFIMEHEHASYPEALKYLAKKYAIEVEEEKVTEEQQLQLTEKESLFNITAFAQKFFSEILWNAEEGKAIGLSYFKERGFSEDTIRNFQLGFSPDKWDVFTQFALSSGYSTELLEKSGFTIKGNNDQLYDRFRSRVMFPIHSISGKVLGFGGRILKGDASKAKYVNSPESDIYHKSNILYGIYFAKTAIINKDNCYLVEGYMDMISLFQIGVENVVASSGTSLTAEQVKLIHRYTNNITILYDGDSAGIKAALRGSDMIVAEGMNVRVVLFPDGEDPDSYARKKRPAEVVEFIESASQDYIQFKTNMLLSETKGDPVKKAGIIREVVETIALVPDPIARNLYVNKFSALLGIAEQTLMNELNKIRRKKQLGGKEQAEEIPINTDFAPEEQTIAIDENSTEFQEKELVTYLIKFGKKELDMEELNEDGHLIHIPMPVANYIIDEIQRDQLIFEHSVYSKIFHEFVEALQTNTIPDEQFFFNHESSEIRETAITLISVPYTYSKNWEEKKKIYVNREEDNLKNAVTRSVLVFKSIKVKQLITENQAKIKELAEKEFTHEALEELLNVKMILDVIRKELAAKLGRIC